MLDTKTVKKALIELELTQTDIARELGVTPQLIHQVIVGRDRSRRVEKYLLKLVRKAQQLTSVKQAV
ncbi:MAG: hypothetical protein Kow0037_01050 [Calditrichia bacterium]